MRHFSRFSFACNSATFFSICPSWSEIAWLSNTLAAMGDPFSLSESIAIKFSFASPSQETSLFSDVFIFCFSFRLTELFWDGGSCLMLFLSILSSVFISTSVSVDPKHICIEWMVRQSHSSCWLSVGTKRFPFPPLNQWALSCSDESIHFSIRSFAFDSRNWLKKGEASSTRFRTMAKWDKQSAMTKWAPNSLSLCITHCHLNWNLGLDGDSENVANTEFLKLLFTIYCGIEIIILFIMPGTSKNYSHSLVFAQIEAAKVLSVSLNYS